MGMVATRFLPAEKRYIPQGVEWIRRGFPAVLPTDTLYGLCADATDPKAVQRVYHLKRRNPKKPLIVLIENLDQLGEFFGMEPPPVAKKLFYHKKPISVVLPVEGNFEYLTRGGKGIAFRLVKGGFIKEFLKELKRPLVAPSANWEGFPPAESPFHAFLYFGEDVPVYYNGGVIKGNTPSALVDLTKHRAVVLRRGPLTEDEIEKLKNLL